MDVRSSVKIGRQRGADVAALLTIALAAFLIRAIPVFRGGGLLGLHGYDDGVYFSAAVAFIHGTMPYRDVLLLHPPGIVLGLAPFAALGGIVGDADAFAGARLAFMVVGALNAVLVALVAGRYDRRAGLIAGVLYAVWRTAASVERNTDFHGPQSTLVLLALFVLCRPGRIGARRAIVGGLILGLATSIELWQGVTVLVLLWWVVVHGRGTGLARLRPPMAYAASAAVGFGLVCAAFFASAPAAMIQDILLDQLGRPSAHVGTVARLGIMEGAPHILQAAASTHPPIALIIVAAAVAGGILIAVTARHRPWTRPWAVLALVQTAVVLATPSFHADYPSLMVAAGALVIGTGLAGLATGLRPRLPRSMPAALPVAVVLGAMAIVSLSRPDGTRLDLRDLTSELAAVRCVSADSPAVLVLTSTIDRDLAQGCPLVIDPTGVLLGGARRAASASYQLAMLDWYTSGDAAVFVQSASDGLDPATKAEIAARLPGDDRDGTTIVRFAAGR